MSSRRKGKFSLKKSNVKTFLFFLLFTSILWLFTQFSKNYTQEVEVTVQFTGIPKDKIVNNKSDHTLKMVLNGNGFRLIGHNWSKTILEFSVDDAVNSNNGVYSFYVDKGGLTINNKLDFKGKVLTVQKDTLRLYLDQNLQKKVPIVVAQNIQYAVGYGSDQGLEVLPDSVLLSGPSQIIDTIEQVRTKHISLDGLNVDYRSGLELDTDNLPLDVVVNPLLVEANISVSKFTEGHQKIPITIQNVPEGLDVRIFPKEISVVYRVGLDKYNDISSRDFVIVADYAKASDESSFLTVELISKSEFIHDVRLQEKQVQFVVLK